MSHRIQKCLLTIVLAMVMPASAATVQVFLDRTIGQTSQLAERDRFLAAVGTTTLINFDTLGTTSITGNEWSASGVLFSNATAGGGVRLLGNGGTYQPQSAPYALWGITYDTLRITPTTTRYAVGFWIIDSERNSGNDRIEVYDTASNLLTTVSMPILGYSTGGKDGHFFIGFIADTPIGRIDILDSIRDRGSIGIDDVYLANMTPVPEPGTWILLGLGLMTLLALRRRT